ncbi:MAG: response regulator [Desulfovibrio sp.]|nr:response regulator [Desulfovibrio sp.]
MPDFIPETEEPKENPPEKEVGELRKRVRMLERRIRSLRSKMEHQDHLFASYADLSMAMAERLEREKAAVIRQNALQSEMNNAASLLLASNGDTLEIDLRNLMGILSRGLQAERLFLFRNCRDKSEKLHCSQMYEWAAQGRESMGLPLVADILYEKALPGWEASLAAGKSINSPVSALAPQASEHLSAQGILSILVLPLILRDSFWGFIGLADYREEKIFSAQEERLLKAGSLLIGGAIIHNEMALSIRNTVAKLETVMRNYAGIIWSVDKEGIVTTFNGLFLQKIGIKPEEMEGKELYAAPENSLLRDLRSHVARTISSGPQDWKSEMNGRILYSRTTPLYDGRGDLAGVVGSTDDITDMIRLQRELKKAVAEAEAANKAKSQFLASMSHEIRTPMNAIIGMCELAMREESSPALREYLASIRLSGSNLLSIVSDILDLSKIEAGNLLLSPGSYTLSSLLDNVISTIRARVFEKPLLFLLNVDPHIPNNLFGDEPRIRQILFNLLGNAVKYTNKGAVRLDISCRFRDEKTILLRMAVEDTGIGIKKEDVGKLFGSFVRLDRERNKEIEGTGLGLVIAKNLCLAMNGEISVSSVYGKGSIFTVVLPQTFTGTERLARVEAPETKKVLLDCSNPRYGESLASSLLAMDVPVVCCRGEEFFRRLEQEDFAFAFVSRRLAETACAAVNSGNLRTTLVLLAEVGDFYPSDRELPCLPMPAYAVSIANVLNGVTAESHARKSLVGFIAPDARVLIVDDIATNLKVLQGLLLPYRMRVDSCDSGRMAVSLVRSRIYDLVFMDHMMPGMDGIEATRKIRALRGQRFSSLPIVALTANALSGMRAMFLENGFNDYLTKPIDLTQLSEIMNKWIPVHKRLRPDAEEAPADLEPGSAPGLDIKGLDARAGIDRSGGSESGFREVLRLFRRDAETLLPELQKPPPAGNAEALRRFVIQVHALKSASANIGAAEVSQLAAILENAGNRGDMPTIYLVLDDFNRALRLLLASIREQLEEADGGAAAGADPLNRDLLLLLRQALQNEDITSVDSALDRLRALPASSSDLDAVERISDLVLVSEFAKAEAEVSLLLAPKAP